MDDPEYRPGSNLARIIHEGIDVRANMTKQAKQCRVFVLES